MKEQLGRRIHPSLEYSSFVDLYKDNYRYVYSIAVGCVKDPTLAEDVTSEVFLAVHKNLRNFKGESRFKTWIYRVTKNTALMKLKKERRHVRGRTGYLPGAVYDKVKPAQLFYLQDRERQELLENGLSEVNGTNRRALELRLLGYNIDEIKTILEIDSVGAVKTRVHRGKRQLAYFVQQNYC
ncbi:RNA polymerase sigma factor [Candidatus Woesearchaeota archaeon]|nr:RNA polymerase sigma factor [Candidatus Woesearchaeota archaeon]